MKPFRYLASIPDRMGRWIVQCLAKLLGCTYDPENDIISGSKGALYVYNLVIALLFTVVLALALELLRPA